MGEPDNSNFKTILLSSIRDAVLLINQDLVIDFCNHGFEKLFGYRRDELRGSSAQVLFLKSDWEDIAESMRKNVEIAKGIKYCIHKNGQRLEAGITFEPIRNEKQDFHGYLIFFRDSEEIKRLTSQLAYTVKEMELANREMLIVNTELEGEIQLRKLVEEELRQQKLKLEKLNTDLEKIVKKEVEANREKERMMVIQSRQASMGEILESVAHQWKQPLNTINLMLYEIEELSKDGLNYEKVKSRISQIYGVIGFMSETINDFRSFFIPAREKKYFRIADAIRQTVRFLEPEFRHSGIEVKMSLEEEAIICGYQNELTQVLLNILNNARDAFSEKKVSNPVIIIDFLKNKTHAVIQIEDNAGGIPDELLPEIFNAYVSTKSEGKGTGLGLYISKTIVERNFQGEITCRNTENGALFQINLPMGDFN